MTTGAADRSDLASISRITPDEARDLVSGGNAVLVDTRPRRYYDEAHAEGAISMPYEEVRRDPRSAIGRLPSGKQLVFYCT